MAQAQVMLEPERHHPFWREYPLEEREIRELLLMTQVERDLERYEKVR